MAQSGMVSNPALKEIYQQLKSRMDKADSLYIRRYFPIIGLSIFASFSLKSN